MRKNIYVFISIYTLHFIRNLVLLKLRFSDHFLNKQLFMQYHFQMKYFSLFTLLDTFSENVLHLYLVSQILK